MQLGSWRAWGELRREQGRNLVEQFVEIDGLGDVGIHASRHALLSVMFQHASCQRNDRQVGVGGV